MVRAAAGVDPASFDVYTGDQVGAGRKSTTFALRFRARPDDRGGDGGGEDAAVRTRRRNGPKVAVQHQLTDPPTGSRSSTASPGRRAGPRGADPRAPARPHATRSRRLSGRHWSRSGATTSQPTKAPQVVVSRAQRAAAPPPEAIQADRPWLPARAGDRGRRRPGRCAPRVYGGGRRGVRRRATAPRARRTRRRVLVACSVPWPACTAYPLPSAAAGPARTSPERLGIDPGPRAPGAPHRAARAGPAGA